MWSGRLASQGVIRHARGAYDLLGAHPPPGRPSQRKLFAELVHHSKKQARQLEEELSRADAAQQRVAAALRVAASTVGRGVGRGVGLGVGALSATGAGVRFVRRRRRPSPPWHVPMPYAARHAFLKLQSSSTSHSLSWFVHLPFLRGVAGAAAGSGTPPPATPSVDDGSVTANGKVRSSLSDCALACSRSAAADTTLSKAAPRIAAQTL